ncbi:MAG: 50S ribosomal protein L5 [Candidatus Niyogibacteria bacterium]|nr:50S ribosomal protein L5 [Candidatus Niyogibacteria bacterium]
MPMTLSEQYQKNIIPLLQKDFGYPNRMAVPRIEKVVINVGVGKRSPDEQKQIARDLSLIAGQKLMERRARQSIASFKVRQGQVIGFKTTLRGRKMYDFIDRLISIALPRTRDFRGIDSRAIDPYGNLTIGIPEHIVFPEMVGEETKFIFGFEATCVTNARTSEEARRLFDALGFPFKK